MPSPRRSLYLFGIAILLASHLLIPLPAYAYPAFTANSDLVIVGPYDTATSGNGNWGPGANTMDFVSVGHKYRIRQNGSITRVRLYTKLTASMTGFYIRIWRKDGATYDLVGTSNNIASQLAADQYSTIDLSTPITGVQEGDYYGYRIEAGGAFYARTSQTGVTTYAITNSTPSDTDFDWEGQTAFAGTVLPIELYMQAPQIVGIGDSIMSGAPNHAAYLVSSLTTSNPSTTILANLSTLTGYTYQNMGVGGQTTTSIASRFSADVLNLKPRVVVSEGGVNDINGGGSKTTFINNWTAMLDAAEADSAVTRVLVLKILPWTNGTTTQMQTLDDWNASLATLAAGYSKAVVVDVSSYVGQFRVGGDPGNLWDIQAAYDADGVHFTAAGYAQIAQALADAIVNLPPEIATLSPLDGANSVAVDANLSITFDKEVIPQSGALNDIIIKRSSDDSIVETIDAQSAQVAGSGTTTITINPTADFAAFTNYYVQIGANAFDDTSGNSFAGISDTTTWNFQTVDSVGEYPYRKEITINHTNVDSDLADFPLYVNIANDADLGGHARSDGYDIRFATSTGVVIPYEREDFHVRSGSGSGDFWVKVPTISSTADTVVYLYYGEQNAEDGENASGAWNSDFAGVWHLDEDVTDEDTSTGAHLDSTSNAHNGTQNGNVETAGTIYNGQDFDGVDDNITIASQYSSQGITVSWWSNCAIVSPTAEGIFSVYRGAGSDRLWGYHWNNSGTNGLYVTYYDASTATYNNRLLDASITQSDWHYYTAVWDEASTTFSLYKDGGLQTTADAVGEPTKPTETTTRLGVGAAAYPGDVNIDEFRISSIARSASWIKFDYANMDELDHGLAVGSQQALAVAASPHGAAAANRAREEWWQEYVEELKRQAAARAGGAAQSSSVSSVASSSSSSSSDPYRLLHTPQSNSSSAPSEGAFSSSAASAHPPSRTERICARVNRWIPPKSPRRVAVLRRLEKWLGITCAG
ncbi:MAG: DUF2341 domain-containing protein [Candidatus Peribacteraceae bacterium]|nr:DUF2341 domain-containing protein [Candidatus Peribacteraceae bacterium]MDD5742821.1 DUF2341 domain-containing protein [Candidatus Peribacteraceae bacterium]